MNVYGGRPTLLAAWQELDDWIACPRLGVSIEARAELFMPTIAVVPRANLTDRPDNEPVPAELALLVVEIISQATPRPTGRRSGGRTRMRACRSTS